MMWRNAGRFVSSASDESAEDSSCYESSADSSDKMQFVDDDTDSSTDKNSIDPLEITRRAPSFGVEVCVQQTGVQQTAELEKARDISALQDFWQEQAAAVNAQYPSAVWRILESVLDQSKVTQDKVLQAVNDILNKSEQENWPKTRKQVDTKLKSTVGTFHARVTRRIRIDLSHIDLHGLANPIQFEFLDPVFSWTVCANELSKKHTLHFEYKQLRHPVTRELLYGASVQHGQLMKRVCAKIPTRYVQDIHTIHTQKTYMQVTLTRRT